MEELKRIIENYVKTEQTDYAILIKGSWGSGKTYFFKNQLSRVIESCSLKPLYISLYGISKLEDLAKTIVLAMFPFLQKKTVEKMVSGAGIVSSALSTISIAGFSLDLGKIVKDLDVSKWVTVGKDKVLCFDDLERAKLDIGQILGFINNFVEHDNIKTILIANEEEIIKNQLKENYPEKVQAAVQVLVKNGSDQKIELPELSKMIDSLFGSKISYPTIKEKLVGRTVEYLPDIESILDSITTIYQSNTALKSFLDSNKQTIIKIFRQSDTQNIRALKGALDTFRVVHNALRKTAEDTLHKHELGLLVFVLAVTLEIRTDEARIREFKHMESRHASHLDILLRKDEKPIPYITVFYDKYFSEGPSEIDFSKAVIRYITDGFFDEEAFLKEYREAEGGITDEKTRKVKSIFNFAEFDDAGFKQTAEDVLRYVSHGEIELRQYPQLFEYFQYFSNSGLISENKAKLKKVFLCGIEAASKKITYEQIRESRSFEPPVQGERSKEYLEIKKSVDDHASKLREAHWAKVCSQLLDLLPDQYEKFQSRYYDRAQEFMILPIFKYYPARKLPRRILGLPTEGLFHFARMMDKRYVDLNIAPDLRDDYTNINLLLMRIEKLLAMTKRKTLRLHWLEQLASVLRKACAKLKVGDGTIPEA